MDVFVARQPIFNRRKVVFGYELLFRSGLENAFRHDDPDLATMAVINNSYFTLGITRLTAGRQAFVNFTRDSLLKGYATILPPRSLVVEILEDVEADEEVLAACRDLKTAGYKLALDDVIGLDHPVELLEMADFVKVDFMQLERNERRSLANDLRYTGAGLLAEKVETEDDFEHAVEDGYAYFQGYFFSKPVIISGKAAEGFKLNYLTLLREVHRPSMSFEKVEGLIAREVSLSYKLLVYLNSAPFGLRSKMDSVRRALLYLGENGVRKWVSLVALSDLASNKPPELVTTSVVRARLCELVALATHLAEREHELFLMGLFSLADAITGQSMEEVLSQLPLPADVNDALLGRSSETRVVYDLMLALERGCWEDGERFARQLGLDEPRVSEMYLSAIEWSSTPLG
ncbi:MAG: HDOD domain-containing protein [Chloroflexi bacterium]|nr:HDOD domain-containing protein [Chloroflexota bacterium]